MSRAFRLAAAAILGSLFLSIPVCPRSGFQSRFKDLNPEWAASGDPCWDIKQNKDRIKKNYGSDAPWITCKKVAIKTIWEIRETVGHHLGKNSVDAAFTCSFPGYLNRNYDQKSRQTVDDFYIGSYPVDARIEIERLTAGIVGFDEIRKNTHTFKIGPADILYDTDQPGGLGMKWRRDLRDWQFWVEGPPFGLAENFIPKPYTTVAGTDLLTDYSVRFEPQVVNFPDWEEIKPFVDGQEIWRRTIPITRHDVNLLGQVRDLKGRVTVEIDFAELEREEWRVVVSGSERNPVDALLPGPKVQGRESAGLPLNVLFDWTMEGRFTIIKRKGVRSYDTGQIVRYVQIPAILGPPPELYRCDLLPVKGAKTWEQARTIAGWYLEGAVQGEAIKFNWFHHTAQAIVLAFPKNSSGQTPIRKTFGSDQFTDAVSALPIPLRDGASVKGGRGDWMTFTITLSKVR